MNQRKLHQAELTSIIRERIDSGDWWIFLPIDTTGAQKLRKIEEEFYWDEVGCDFDVVILPELLFSVALGRKTRLPRERLIDQLSDSKTTALSEVGKRDIMILGEEGPDNVLRGMFAMATLTALYERRHPDMN